MNSTGWPAVHEFLEFFELFMIFFCSGIVHENHHFFISVHEMVMNIVSEWPFHAMGECENSKRFPSVPVTLPALRSLFMNCS